MMPIESESDWIEQAAVYIARRSLARRVTTEHLWLAILVNGASEWAQLVAAYGGGTYEEWRKVWNRAMTGQGRSLPADWTAHPSDVSGSSLTSSKKMKLGLMALLIRVLAHVFRRRQNLDPSGMPWSPAAARVRRIARGQERYSGSGGHYLIALAALPGEHQYMIRARGPIFVAAARKKMNCAGFGDKVNLGLAWPAKVLRAYRRKLWMRAHQPKNVATARAAYWLVVGLEIVMFIPASIVLGSALIVLYIALAPAILLLNGFRSAVGVATSVQWRYRDGLTYPGGEVEVVWGDDDRPASPKKLLLLPRALLFVAGEIGLIAVFYRTFAIGQPPLSLVINHPYLLQTLWGPLYFVADDFGTNGGLIGWTGIVAAGALFISLPTPREIEEVKLVRAGRSRDNGSPGSSFVSVVSGAFRFVYATNGLIGWTASPAYVALGVIPLTVGVLCAAIVAKLLT